MSSERSPLLRTMDRRGLLTLLGTGVVSTLLAACAPAASAPKPDEAKPSLPAAAPVVNEATASAVVRIDLGGDPAFTFYGTDLVQHQMYFSMKNAYRLDEGRRVGPMQYVNFAFNRYDYVGLDLDGPTANFKFTPLDESIRAVGPREKGLVDQWGEKMRPTVFEGRLSVIKHQADSVLTEQYLVQGNDGPWGEGSPISWEKPEFVHLDRAWKIEQDEAGPYARFIGKRGFFLSQGNTASGTVAYLFQRYPTRAVFN